MNLPRAYARGFTLFKQPSCLPRILRPLVLDVGSDYFLIDAHSGNKVACRPEAVCTPVYFFEKFKLFFHISWAIGFVEPYETSDVHAGWDRYEHVDMVFLVVKLLDS